MPSWILLPLAVSSQLISAKLIDLKSIVQGIIYKLGLEQEFWTKFYQYGIDGMREITLFHLNIEKSVKLEMSAD